MPTVLPRTPITHKPNIVTCLRIGQARWPNEKPSVLLERLIEKGAESISSELSPLDRMIALGQAEPPTRSRSERQRRTYDTTIDLNAMLDADRNNRE